jgi:hypothetical protein
MDTQSGIRVRSNGTYHFFPCTVETVAIVRRRSDRLGLSKAPDFEWEFRADWPVGGVRVDASLRKADEKGD